MNITQQEIRQARWDEDYLALARFWALRKSKDPSTKVGAVVVDDQLSVRTLGYNGFPRGVEDTEERLNDRELKYELVVHAEMNALLAASGPVRGCTLYAWPLPSCSACAKMIIQAGIRRVVFPPLTGERRERWLPSWQRAFAMYEEAGVQVSLVRLPEDAEVEARARAKYLLGAVTRFIRSNDLQEWEVEYDGAVCDGECLAVDCESAGQALRS